jgi:hypothetical protein
LSIQSDGKLLRIWDCEQAEEAPQSDQPIITDRVQTHDGTREITAGDRRTGLQERDRNTLTAMTRVDAGVGFYPILGIRMTPIA